VRSKAGPFATLGSSARARVRWSSGAGIEVTRLSPIPPNKPSATVLRQPLLDWKAWYSGANGDQNCQMALYKAFLTTMAIACSPFD
jgi:hypothetical protein